MQKVISNARALNFDPRSLPPMPAPRTVLMVRPTHFHVDNPINPHMRKADGTLHALDKNRAAAQWEALRETYKALGFHVVTLEGGPGLPDMVFCANQSLPLIDTIGDKVALSSNMANDTRHKEVPLVSDALRSLGYTVTPIADRTPETFFEGMGDCLWLPGRRFLLGGYGSRTRAAMYEKVTRLADAPVAVFSLVHPRFYHLDTCLSILDASSALACRDAFSAEGWELLNAVFPNLIEVPLVEADSPHFACNAHCPDGKHVIVQAGCAQTEGALKKAGYVPVPVDTDEFIKSGGSVFCMKLMVF